VQHRVVSETRALWDEMESGWKGKSDRKRAGKQGCRTRNVALDRVGSVIGCNDEF